jgi:uncharacterized protein (TIGR03382 family)
VTPDERLEYAFALDADALGEFTPRAQLDAEALGDVYLVSARARDEAGNRSPLVRLQLRRPDAEPGARGAGGCDCAAHGAAPLLPVVPLLGGLLLLRRKRGQRPALCAGGRD